MVVYVVVWCDYCGGVFITVRLVLHCMLLCYTNPPIPCTPPPPRYCGCLRTANMLIGVVFKHKALCQPMCTTTQLTCVGGGRA